MIKGTNILSTDRLLPEIEAIWWMRKD